MFLTALNWEWHGTVKESANHNVKNHIISKQALTFLLMKVLKTIV